MNNKVLASAANTVASTTNSVSSTASTSNASKITSTSAQDNTSKRTGKNRFKEGFDFFTNGLCVFGVIGLELILAYVIEPLLYSNIEVGNYKSFYSWQTIAHWIVTCALWIAGAILVAKQCRKETGFDLIGKTCSERLADSIKNIRLWQWIMIVAGVTICLISTWIDWNGSKVMHEFASKGLILFIFQYGYYLVETALVLMIIIFGQKAFEKWFNNNIIPFGGILVAVTWGLGHWMTKGSLMTGLYTAFGGFVFGSVYVLTNRNVKLSYILLCIMFIL